MDITDNDIPQPRMLTEEESLEMKENLAQRNFGMNLAEFTKAWLDGEFDGDRERHGNVIFLASMLPEYWTDSNCQGRGNEGPPGRRQIVPPGAIVQHRATVLPVKMLG